MKLLAVDQGSTVCAAAYFEDGRLVSVDRFQPRAGDWLDRMESIATELRACKGGRGWAPDVVAIEDVALWMNPRTLAVMGETRGFLKAWTRWTWPRVQVMDVNIATIAKTLGLRGNAPRDERKAAAMALALEIAARDRTPRPVLFDENIADAVAVGVAALKRLDVARDTGRELGEGRRS